MGLSPTGPVVAAIAPDDGPRRECVSGQRTVGFHARQDRAFVVGSVTALARRGAPAVGHTLVLADP